MSKYVELAVKVNQVEDVKTKAEKSAPILNAKLKAIVSSQEAKVMEAQAELAEKEAAVETARGYITTDAQYWLKKLNDAKTSRDQAAEELNIAQEYLEELQEELKLFA